MRKTTKKQQSTSFLYKFAQFLIRNSLLFEEENIQINYFIIFVIQGLSVLQLLGIFVIHYTQNQKLDELDGPMQVLNELCKIARPYLYLSDRTLQYLFLIPFLIIILDFLVNIYFYNQNKQFMKKNSKYKISNKIIQYIFGYIGIVYIQILLLPFIELSLLSLKSNIQQNNAFGAFLSCITFLLIMCFGIFQMSLQESLNIDVRNLHLLKQHFTEYWFQFIIVVLLFIKGIELEWHQQGYLLFPFIMSCLMIKVYNIFSNYITTYYVIRIKIFYYIAAQCILIYLFIQMLSNNQRQHSMMILIMIYPLILYVAIRFYQYTHFKALQNRGEEQQIDALQYKIVHLLNIYQQLQKSFKEDTQLLTFIYIYYFQHKSYCENIKCLCQKHKEQLHLENIIKLFLQDQVSIFCIQINYIKENTTKVSFFLHYLSMINHLGMTTNAFQQANVLVYEESQYSSQYQSAILQAQVQRNSSSQSNEQKSSSQQKSKTLGKNKLPHLKFGHLSFLQSQKLQIIQEIINSSLTSSFTKFSDYQIQENLQHAVKLFLKSEESNRILKKKVMKIISLKKDYFTNLYEQNSKFNLYKYSKKLAIQLDKLEQNLQKLYDQFPSQKMQALNSFFQSEIRNNYFKAYKLANITSVSDEKLMKMQAQSSFNLFSSNIVYLIVGFDEKTHALKVQQHSNSAYQYFGISQDQFQIMQDITFLLPQSFSQIHDKLVQSFLQNGISKYFRQINLNFCMYGTKYLKTINFFFDITSLNLDDFKFACFFQDYEQSNAFIFINSSFKIISFTKTVISKLGYHPQAIKEIYRIFHKLPIIRIIPNFQQLVNEISFQQDQIHISQQEIYLPKEQDLQRQTQLSINWEISEQLMPYKVDFIIYIRVVEHEQLYYILEITEAKQIHQQLFNDRTLPLSYQNPTIMDQFELENEFELFGILDEEEVRQPNNISNVVQECDLPDGQFGVHFKDVQKDKSFNPQSNSYYNPSHNAPILSPKIRDTQLINSTIKKGSEFQKFYAQSFIQDQEMSNSQNISKRNDLEEEQKNKIDQLQLEEIDEDVQENLRIQMQLGRHDQNIVHIDDIGSQVSSIAGIKKSKYFKKYELIERMTTSNKFSINFNLTLLFIFIFLIFSLSMQLTTIINLSSDLERFLLELDMLQIRSNLMGPIDKFIVCINSVLNYIIVSIFLQAYSFEVAIEKFEYSEKDVVFTYQDLTKNFDNQMQNPYLIPFFKDRYIIVKMANEPNVDEYNITVREALNLYKEASYNFARIDYKNIFGYSLSVAFITYSYANYPVFTELFKSLNEEMLSYSISRSYLVSQKWLAILIPSLIVSAIVLGIGYLFYKFYLKQYEKILCLFNLIDPVWLQRDLHRYKGILSLLQKDNDVLFKYQFDLEFKEKFLSAEELKRDKLQQNQRYGKQNSKQKEINNLQTKLNYLPSVIMFLLIYCYYFVFSFLSHELASFYFRKYPDTTYFFNSLSDLSLASSGVFAMRQLCYQIQYPDLQYYFFFEHSDGLYFQGLFHEDIDVINNFLQQMVNFNPNKLLTSDSFVDQLNNFLKQDVCSFLPEDKRALAQSHCDVVYDGVLRRGYQETLVKVRDSLLNEFITSKNFTYITYSTAEELEAGLIGYDTVNILRSMFQIELINYTTNLINSIKIINIVYICLSILIIFLMQFQIKSYFQQEFKIVKSFILLLPQSSLLLDSQVDRTLRQLIVKDNLI